ncbi:hypothetical protein MKJ04_14605 [Pontibacter sp. E15-1]|uniref:hypothetical protein n=1 Tax=Pontibacter sp. E15-1 TaxID=2919918 RepID=UPI001F502451|nr:hypothetical protein [Pontibacter sp. E15-1]MCJ8166075.1 hypothetical protein [Pontibacter sp. E15-1]
MAFPGNAVMQRKSKCLAQGADDTKEARQQCRAFLLPCATGEFGVWHAAASRFSVNFSKPQARFAVTKKF